MSNNIIVSSLDQPLRQDADGFLREIKRHILEAVESGNADRAFGVVKQLRLASQLSGLSLAQTLWLIRDNWDSFDIEGDFEEIAYERIGLHKSTVREYCRVWELFETGYIPDQLSADFKNKNIKDLKYLANTVSKGYEIENEDWIELSEAPDYSTLSKKIREIRGVKPRAGSLQLYLEEDGTLYAYHNERIKYVGFLDVKSDDDSVKKAINRITDNAGVMEK